MKEVIEIRKKGRPDKYDEYVKPYLEDIYDWIKTMNEKQIAEKLGISVRSFVRYKEKYGELRNVLKKGRQNLVIDLKDKLINIALNGIHEVTTETVMQIVDDDGKKKTVKKIEKTRDGDKEAILKILNNYDENWHECDIPKLKRLEEELKIKRELADESMM